MKNENGSSVIESPQTTVFTLTITKSVNNTSPYNFDFGATIRYDTTVYIIFNTNHWNYFMSYIFCFILN